MNKIDVIDLSTFRCYLPYERSANNKHKELHKLGGRAPTTVIPFTFI